MVRHRPDRYPLLCVRRRGLPQQSTSSRSELRTGGSQPVERKTSSAPLDWFGGMLPPGPSQLNRWPAPCARESGGAPVALSPMRGWTAPPAPVEPVAQPDSVRPVPGRIKSQIAPYKREITV
ncbi:MAG: hypothetical protein HY866_23905 [Chloroflexi bacterium]|nr:hypothetical protein [Chloroflexota bacterium]